LIKKNKLEKEIQLVILPFFLMMKARHDKQHFRKSRLEWKVLGKLVKNWEYELVPVFYHKIPKWKIVVIADRNQE
jgi:hypothetical protein